MVQEKKLQLLMPNGHKEIRALVKIADSMLEIEVGKKWLREWLRGKDGNMRFDACTAEESTEVTSDVEDGIQELDEARKRVLEMIQGWFPRKGDCV